MRRFILLILIISIILPGCAGNRAIETAPSETETPETAVTIPETNPLITPESIPETAPETVPPTEPEPEPVAEQITEGYEVKLNDSLCNYYLSDDNHYSKRRVTSDDLLHIISETPFSSLYIEWDTLPGTYEIVWEGGSLTCGQEGFLHDYIRLPEAVERVEFVLQDGTDCMICDVLLYTEGTAPEGVQDWLEPCEEADILVFPTHSDDDALFFGPLISYYAVERELKVQTAFMVEHHWYYERSHERLNGLWEMGVRYYPILGTAPDTAVHDMGEAMRYYADSDIGGWQIEQIRRFKPLVVVGHDLEGEYGNGGHKVNAYYLVRAIEQAADPEQYPESADQYGVWDTPKLYIHLYPENEITLDVNTPMEKDPQGRTPFEAAEDAYSWHWSQRITSYRVRQDGNRMYDCRFFGLYRTLVGNDTMADIMENITAEDWRQ